MISLCQFRMVDFIENNTMGEIVVSISHKKYAAGIYPLWILRRAFEAVHLKPLDHNYVAGMLVST